MSEKKKSDTSGFSVADSCHAPAAPPKAATQVHTGS